MLTCSKNNPAGTKFYLEKMKYTIDPISPSYVNPGEEYSYEIVSKIFDEKARQMLQLQADEAREEFLESSDEESDSDAEELTEAMANVKVAAADLD